MKGGLVEILEKGTIPKEPKYILRCPRCNSKLKCDMDDIKTTGLYKFFVCPVCSQRNYIDDYDLTRARVFDGDS